MPARGSVDRPGGTCQLRKVEGLANGAQIAGERAKLGQPGDSFKRRLVALEDIDASAAIHDEEFWHDARFRCNGQADRFYR